MADSWSLVLLWLWTSGDYLMSPCFVTLTWLIPSSHLVALAQQHCQYLHIYKRTEPGSKLRWVIFQLPSLSHRLGGYFLKWQNQRACSLLYDQLCPPEYITLIYNVQTFYFYPSLSLQLLLSYIKSPIIIRSFGQQLGQV